MNEHLISVIVTAYNVEKYIDRCIKSLVTQTYTHLEIILVDDGSTDRTGEICDDWGHKDDRVIVIHKANGGVSDARNAGVQRASGKWLGFVDGDDYARSTMYEHLYKYRVEQGITVCGYQTEKNGILHPYPATDKNMSPKESVFFHLENEFKARYYGTLTYWGAYAWNKLYDRALFTGVLYPVGQTFEDTYLIFELIRRAASIRFIPDCEYVYVWRAGSITNEFGNIALDFLQALLYQKEQLFKFWQITDSRIDQLIAYEYYSILNRYAILAPEKRRQHQETAKMALKELRKLGYTFMPLKKRVRLFMFIHCPDLFCLLRKWKIKYKGESL